MITVKFGTIHKPETGMLIRQGVDGPMLGTVSSFSEMSVGGGSWWVWADLLVNELRPSPSRRLYMDGHEIHSFEPVSGIQKPEGGPEAINHPAHYGGDTPYEAIKVIEAWGLGFSLGNAVKYISRAGKKAKDKVVEDLKKAAWYLNREIESIEGRKEAPKEPAKTAEVAWSSELKSEIDKARREGALAAMKDATDIVSLVGGEVGTDLGHNSEKRPQVYLDRIQAKLVFRREEIEKGLPRRV